MMDNTLLLLQIAVIVGLCRVVATIFHRFGQPQVVGEMVAGIALGPTLFGFLAPAAYEALFPVKSLGFLTSLSQVGLTVFMYLVGVRVDLAELRRQSGLAIVTSNISVVVPFAMGIALAQYLYPQYGSGNPLAFALFIGTAMSVTAFPVLARILVQRNLLHTRLGSIAIACAAVDDITAWILLASVVTLVKNDAQSRPIWLILAYLVGYGIFMLMVGWFLNRWAQRSGGTKMPIDALLSFIVMALVSGAIAEWIGIHSLVGAFLAGLVTPRIFRQHLIDKLETITVVVLIPIFFALTGIRTNLIFTAGGAAYLDLVFIFLVAVVSKWGGTMIAARAKGMDWDDACQLGLLMNTRGLVELIVLTVGLDHGILSPTLFSMMVCMALLTTFMATPLMDWTGRMRPKAAAAAA